MGALPGDGGVARHGISTIWLLACHCEHEHEQDKLERLDEGFGAQAGDPFFLEVLGLLLHQLLFDFVARFGQALGRAAALLFHFQDIKVITELDDVADFADRQTESHLLELSSE